MSSRSQEKNGMVDKYLKSSSWMASWLSGQMCWLPDLSLILQT